MFFRILKILWMSVIKQMCSIFKHTKFYIQCTYLSYSNHKRKKFSTTNVSNMWMIHYFSKLMWPVETLQRNTMALPVTSSSKWKIFSNFLAFSEYPNFNSQKLILKNLAPLCCDVCTFSLRVLTCNFVCKKITLSK